MESKALLEQTASEESLSALSTQLVSLGYLSRPLDLSTLFLAPSLPSTASAKHVRKHQDLLILQARAREQIAKCLWGMLEQRQAERATIETLLAREARANEEAERERAAADRARKEREAMGRELEAEKARAKEAEQKLRAEQDRHRHTRDELAKSKNALQFVKTQALHDQKRREAEVQSLHQRLQKLTTAPASNSADAAYTRFTILNGNASPTTASPRIGGMTSGTVGRSARPPASSSRAPTPTNGSAASAAVEAELELVRSALEERMSTCSHLDRENRDLRTFVGEVGEWAEGVLDFEELANVRKDREEGGEMRGVLNNGDESHLIPSPHLALPVAALTSPLHRKLYAIRLGLSSLTEQSAATLTALRDELEGEIERLHEEVEEEVVRREATEREREEALEAVRKGEMLVEEWAQRAQEERRRRVTGSPASDEDEAPAMVDVRRAKHKQDSAPAPADELRPEAPAPSRTQRPSAPSARVASFLADLGLDTPANEAGKAPLRAEQPQRESDRRSRDREDRPRVRSSSERARNNEKEGDMLPPARPAKQPSSRAVSASSSGASLTSTGSRQSTTSSNTASSRSSRNRDLDEEAQSKPIPSGPSSTLKDILALADSPPVASAPLVSSEASRTRNTSARAPSASRSGRREREREGDRAVLAAATPRVVNAANEEKAEELDPVTAKKQALLARARSTSARRA